MLNKPKWRNWRNWKNWILPGVLALALIGTGVWGYSESQARQNLQNRAESQYQKAFLELSWHLDTISGQLAQLLVGTSKEQEVLGLATLWRQAFAAQANIGGLPLAFVPLSKTEKFLFDTGEVAYNLLRRSAKEAGGLQEKDARIIQELHSRSKLLKTDLNKLASQVLNDRLSWTEVEVATLQANKELEDNTIVNGFQLMERRMEEYPELDLGEDFVRARPDLRVIRGEQKITLQKAQEIAHNWWFSPEDKHTASLSFEGIGDIPTFGLEFPPLTKEDSPVYVDVSKLDGSVVWVMKPKPIAGTNMDLSEGERISKAFLEKHGFGDMVLIKVEQEGNAGVYTFVPRQDNVLLYPDQVKTQVALDNGEVIGYEGTPYYMYHRKRDLPAPTLSEDKIRQMVSPYLKVDLIRPALIADYWGKEIMVWEVRGSFAEEKFVIFYNARSGREELIDRITPPARFDFSVAR